MMAQGSVIEGTWEEIQEHAAELSGHRLRVTVLDEQSDTQPLPRANREMLLLLDEWRHTPLTDEERQVLDEFETFRKEHPIRFRRLDQEDE